jgi:hypothetical protein
MCVLHDVEALGGCYNILTHGASVAAISRMDIWSLGFDWTSKRNLTMRCIIPAFPLSRALGYWLLVHSTEPIMLLSGSAVRLAHMSIED